MDTSVSESKSRESAPPRFNLSVPATASPAPAETSASRFNLSVPELSPIIVPTTAVVTAVTATATTATTATKAASDKKPTEGAVWMSRSKAAAVATAQPIDVSNQIMFPALGGKRPAAATGVPVAVAVTAKSFANIVKTMAEKTAAEAARVEHAEQERERLRQKEALYVARHYDFHKNRASHVQYSAPHEEERGEVYEEGGEEGGGYNPGTYGGYNSNRYGVGSEEFDDYDEEEDTI